MKKAIIDQLFLGFLLLMGMVTFVATVNDETSTRNYIYDLNALAKSSAEAMARYYENNIDMCTAQTITSNILNQSKHGNETLNNGLVSYRWWDSDNDGEPDQVTATIAQHQHDSFWYRFFDKDDFAVGPFSWTEAVNTPKNVTITYGGEDAGYTNMVGLYELDSNNCVINPRIILADSDDDSMIGQLLNNGQAITSPPTYTFVMSDGYNTFANGSNRPTESDSVTMNHCFSDVDTSDNDDENPTVTINGITASNSHTYFEHNELNGDGYHHIQIIPHNVWDFYNTYVDSGHTYDDFIAMCNNVNYDADDSNNIPSVGYEEDENDCIHDANDEYHYAMEDLNGGGDEDFNDIFLNTTRVVIPNELNTYTVLDDNSINLICGGNAVPTLIITCPDPVEENTSTSISYTANDSDGNIAQKSLSAFNGTVVDNNDGTITYTPDTDFFGTDTLSMSIQDNDGASNTQTCTITVNEVNLPPIINGNPMTSIEAGNTYIFIPTASDPDGDTLSFSISNKPSWASFSATTGQLSGVPTNSNVNTYINIVVSVSDGTNATSLNSFNITVTENTSNNEPICSTIPTQSATETEAFNSLNLDTYCTDSDGDDVSYTLTASSLGYSGTTDGLVSINPVPDNTASLSPITVTVVASDGTDSTTTSFILNITANAECSINDTENFTVSGHGWSGGYTVGNSNKKYRIDRDDTGYKTYSFGNSCKNVDVLMSFRYRTNSWENSDNLELYINNTYITEYNQSDGGYTTKSITVQTDSSGNLKISFIPNSSQSNEYVRIDDIELSK